MTLCQTALSSFEKRLDYLPMFLPCIEAAVALHGDLALYNLSNDKNKIDKLCNAKSFCLTDTINL